MPYHLKWLRSKTVHVLPSTLKVLKVLLMNTCAIIQKTLLQQQIPSCPMPNPLRPAYGVETVTFKSLSKIWKTVVIHKWRLQNNYLKSYRKRPKHALSYNNKVLLEDVVPVCLYNMLFRQQTLKSWKRFCQFSWQRFMKIQHSKWPMSIWSSANQKPVSASTAIKQT